MADYISLTCPPSIRVPTTQSVCLGDAAELAGSEPAKWLARDRRDRFEVSIAMDDDLFGDDGGTCDQYVDES
ncbi:MAG: hypothetical protein WCK20_02090 [Thermoleophilia bacterium]